MKILIATGIYPPDIGGPATYSKLLKEELPGQGIDVTVVTFGKLKKYPWILRQPVYFIKVLLAARNADIIYAQDVLNSGISALIAGKLWKKKFLLKIVGDYAWEQGVWRFGVKEILDDFLDKKYGFKVELFRKLERWVANNAEKIIVPSEYLKKVVIKWGVEPEKIIVIYNAFDAPHGALASISKEDAKKQLGLEGKIIVSAGRLVPWKGFDALIEIIPELSKKFGDALDERAGLKLIIIGEGPERNRLESVRNRAWLVEKVIFTGVLSRDAVLDYLRAADVFALNTSYEGLSHQILEAMGLGVPVVTTDVGGNPELVIDGITGFLVGFNDKFAFAEKINKILSDKGIAAAMSENAKKKAEEFSKERMINETIKILKQ
ncbi:MAG: glycosyltransferase family 4 protein [bacterium]|nr:glycosyltransferase family 4 protein [bacterium]